MKENRLHEKDISKKCDLCGKDILVDQYGFGICTHCGWQNNEAALQNPDYPYLGNFLSFNNAKRLLSEGKPLKPSFEEFMEFMRVYGEVQFTYKEKVYGIYWHKDKIILFDTANENYESEYESYDDFGARANIGGLLVKNIWDDVTKIDYLQ